MNRKHFLRVLALAGVGVALLSTSPQGQTPQGKLILFADIAVFHPPPDPQNCTIKNRFKPGEQVGFRLWAKDGGTGMAEMSAEVVVHLEAGGKKYEIPAIHRDVAHINADDGKPLPVKPDLWTAKWRIPMDAPTGRIKFTASAKDKYGRTAVWTPEGAAYVTIVTQ